MSSSDDNALVVYVATMWVLLLRFESVETNSANSMPYEYCLFAGTALLLYDTVLTFGTEVNVMWRPKLSVKALIHILNRYGAIAAYISAVVLLFPVNDRVSYPRLIRIHMYSATLRGLVLLRMYALSDCNIPLSIFVLVLNMMYIVPDIVSDPIIEHFFNDLPPYGCYQNAVEDNVIVPCVMDIERDIVTRRNDSPRLDFQEDRPVAINTPDPPVWFISNALRGALQQRCRMLRARGTVDSVPLVFNVITLALTLVDTDMAASIGQCVVVFRDALTTILVSRFLLDLGAFGVHPNNGTNASTEGAGTGTMRFASELSDSHAESEGSVKRETTWMRGDEYELRSGTYLAGRDTVSLICYGCKGHTEQEPILRQWFTA
ncbi:hypothetical protein C8Q74DRAFT_1222329 [Fomes fomentarius]|nr:hypothetical protein C8Q74DRAFT_1222329 [Fomes fomentarius]